MGSLPFYVLFGRSSVFRKEVSRALTLTPHPVLGGLLRYPRTSLHAPNFQGPVLLPCMAVVYGHGIGIKRTVLVDEHQVRVFRWQSKCVVPMTWRVGRRQLQCVRGSNPALRLS